MTPPFDDIEVIFFNFIIFGQILSKASCYIEYIFDDNSAF